MHDEGQPSEKWESLPFEAFLLFAELEFSRRMAEERGLKEPELTPGEWIDHGLV
ncbi:hypothetical protein [Agrobacterium cavarae]|uniref:hypothetical protein n=1 Tax=Agrobacterium cavarae TaxID=2528239 RepID=UPI002FDB3A3B